MALELQYLVWTVALALVQMLISVLTAIGKVGMPPLLANREGLQLPEGLAGRARRAHFNMLESLAPFGLLVVVAVLAHRTNGVTSLAVQLFFWARVGYAVVYLVGVPYLRTLIWGVGLIGIVMLFARLI